MIDTVMLDAGPLGRLARRHAPTDISEWLQSLLVRRVLVIVPEVADFEIRRELLLAGLTTSVAALNRLKANLHYAPITTPIMLHAAELWADARAHGKPTADPKSLDCDVIPAAQALDAGAVIATENIGHLSRLAKASHWREIRV